MKIAYLILAHTLPLQLKRLVERLYGDSIHIFIHIDGNLGNISEFTRIGELSRNIRYIRGRADVQWGGFSVVQATLHSLYEIAEHRPGFDYVVLMSGTDYPIKSRDTILRFFEENQGSEFIHYFRLPLEEAFRGRLDRLWYYYDFDNLYGGFESPGGSLYKSEMRERGLKKDFIPGMKPFQGSQWWALTGACVDYILEVVKSNVEVTNYYRYTKFSDEQFFQTLVMNSPFRDSVCSDGLWYVDWSWGGEGKAVLHPKTLNASDYMALACSPMLYARKFNQMTNPGILDMLDQYILLKG